MSFLVFTLSLALATPCRLEPAEFLSLEDGVVSVQTEDGNVWAYEPEHPVAFGDCMVLFDTHGTESIYDDSILVVVPDSMWSGEGLS